MHESRFHAIDHPIDLGSGSPTVKADMREELEQIREWADAKIAANQIPRESIRFLGSLSLWLALILAAHTPALADIGRPNRDAGPTRVKVFIALLDIDKISGADQSFDANFFYMLRWTDPRLAHDQERKSMPLNEVWHPRIQILNQQKGTVRLKI